MLNIIVICIHGSSEDCHLIQFSPFSSSPLGR